jgi:hypothetical protein
LENDGVFSGTKVAELLTPAIPGFEHVIDGAPADVHFDDNVLLRFNFRVSFESERNRTPAKDISGRGK